MMTTGGVFATDNATAVMNRLSGFRPKKEIVKRFFGINDEQFNKGELLKKMGVRYHEKLAELGVTKADFGSLFEDILPKSYLDGNNEGGAKESGNTIADGLEAESVMDGAKRGTKRASK